jgi:hypothetical protein
LNIDPPAAEIFVDVARAAQALAPRVAPSILKFFKDRMP